MLIIPRMLIQNGKCVTLERGRIDEPSIWHVDPVEAAMRFARDGAEWLHVTDLDAVAGRGSNENLVVEIIRRAGTPVQVGGGIRTLDCVARWADHGAGRIVIASAAVRSPHFVKEAAKLHPDQVAVAVDIWEGKVVIGGWTETTAFDPIPFITSFRDAPLAAFIVTDVDREVDVTLSSFARTTKIAGATDTPVISAGLIRTYDDISTLRYVYNVAGAMLDKPLFDKSIDLAEAIELARATPEPVPEFQ